MKTYNTNFKMGILVEKKYFNLRWPTPGLVRQNLNLVKNHSLSVQYLRNLPLVWTLIRLFDRSTHPRHQLIQTPRSELRRILEAFLRVYERRVFWVLRGELDLSSTLQEMQEWMEILDQYLLMFWPPNKK